MPLLQRLLPGLRADSSPLPVVVKPRTESAIDLGDAGTVPDISLPGAAPTEPDVDVPESTPARTALATMASLPPIPRRTVQTRSYLPSVPTPLLSTLDAQQLFKVTSGRNETWSPPLPKPAARRSAWFAWLRSWFRKS